jgi:hypothetical protein
MPIDDADRLKLLYPLWNFHQEELPELVQLLHAGHAALNHPVTKMDAKHQEKQLLLLRPATVSLWPIPAQCPPRRLLPNDAVCRGQETLTSSPHCRPRCQTAVYAAVKTDQRGVCHPSPLCGYEKSDHLENCRCVYFSVFLELDKYLGLLHSLPPPPLESHALQPYDMVLKMRKVFCLKLQRLSGWVERHTHPST